MGLTTSDPFAKSVAFTAGVAAVLCAAGAWDGWARFGAPGEAFARRLRTGELNKQDATLLQRGYYENLMGAGRFNNRMLEALVGQPPPEHFKETAAARTRDDFLDVELVPNVRTTFHGVAFSTNRWGFRDRDYEQDRPADAFRLAVLGASITMGWGVADGESFPDRLEDRLNADASSAPFATYEVLNFAVAGYTAPQQLIQLNRVLEFLPQVVLVVSHEVEIDRALTRIAGTGEEGPEIPLDSLRRAADWAWRGTTNRQAAAKRLQPYRYQLLEWIYREVVKACRARGAIPVWVFVPTLERVPDLTEVETIRDVAARAGMVLVNLVHVYDAVDRRALRIGDGDAHPNVDGHDLVAATLDSALRANPAFAPDLPRARGETPE